MRAAERGSFAVQDDEKQGGGAPALAGLPDREDLGGVGLRGALRDENFQGGGAVAEGQAPDREGAAGRRGDGPERRVRKECGGWRMHPAV